MRGTLFGTDRILNQVRHENARARGEEYNRCAEAGEEATNKDGLAQMEGDVGAHFRIGDDWVAATEDSVETELNDLQDMEVIAESEASCLSEIFQTEGKEPVLKQISHERTVEDCIMCALQDVGDGTRDRDASDRFKEIEKDGKAVPAASSSRCMALKARFVLVAKKLQKEAQLLLENKDNAVWRKSCNEVLSLAESLVSDFEVVIRK